jgi:hypothetical protein
MSTSSIGKLQRVPLREVWKHETHDFTQWLQENIDTLNAALDLSLVNVEREQDAGDCNIDLVAEDDGGQTVVIENQLEKSYHDHLGKLITYVTAMSAHTAIWIVSRPRPEHVAAIAWLNESSSASFYMVKVEAVRIGESPAAPLFTVIVGPSDVATDAGQTKREIAERFSIRKRWWTTLLERAAKVSKLHASITPGEYSWVGMSSGIRGLNFNYSVNLADCGAELYIDRGKNADEENKRIFDRLFAQCTSIEQNFGGPLSCERLDGKRASRIRYDCDEGGYRSPEEQWPQIQDRVIDAMTHLERALHPHLAKIKDKSIEEP